MIVSRKTTVTPANVHQILGKHILADGFSLVLDLQKSEGMYVYDKLEGKKFVDFFTFFASNSLGLNHPKLRSDAAFMERLMDAALNNISNSDIYTEHYARFVDTFDRVGIPSYLPNAFFVAGGALAIENALKTAFDWKVRKNWKKGYRGEHGHKVLHFEQAFHGRSGYTMSLTNTDPNKVALFPKFEWCRVLSPHCNNADEPIEQIEAREALAIAQIKRHFAENPDDIAAIIIEPIQAEGGDNHFRKSFLQQLRYLADEHEAMLIFDEVQTGVGLTGAFWAHQAIGVNPDIVAFGKKMQVCGILVSDRVHEVEDNVFKKGSRINSTWGGNLVDMVRADKVMEIIEEDQLLLNVREQGKFLVQELKNLAAETDQVLNPRGMGLMCAFDMPNVSLRNQFLKDCYNNGLIILGCGEQTVRFRPALNATQSGLSEGLEIIRYTLENL